MSILTEQQKQLLDSMTKIDTYEDCPVGEMLLVWDGCNFDVEYVDVCAETGCYYPANNIVFEYYFELPDQLDVWNYKKDMKGGWDKV